MGLEIKPYKIDLLGILFLGNVSQGYSLSEIFIFCLKRKQLLTWKAFPLEWHYMEDFPT